MSYSKSEVIFLLCRFKPNGIGYIIISGSVHAFALNVALDIS